MVSEKALASPHERLKFLLMGRLEAVIDIAEKELTWRSVLNNETVAQHLDEVAQLLEKQGANRFRVAAYRKVAITIHYLDRPVQDIFDTEGRPGLVRLEGIGRSIACSIEQLLRTGKMPLLERLRGESAPGRIFTTVPDIGAKLARRIHEELGIESLAELQAAAWDGRLARLPGLGKKRIQAVRESLAGRSRRQDRANDHGLPQPPLPPHLVAELLDIDQSYRRLAELDRLPRLAPRRFNPEGKAWLPILHTQRGDRHYTALFSNTARAHELGTTRDWVVIYRDDHADHGQWTVITAGLGRLTGRRIIRGLEQQCAAYYATQVASNPSL